MVRGDLIGSLFYFILSLVAVIESYRLGLGTMSSPQAGFLPFVVSITLGVLSLILLITTIKQKTNPSDQSEFVAFNRRTTVKVTYIVASLFFYALFLHTLGFILVTIILIGFLLGTTGPQKWYTVSIESIAISLIAYVLFDVFLGVQLPKGFLGF